MPVEIIGEAGTPGASREWINAECEKEDNYDCPANCRSDARSFFRAMAAECDLPQWHIASSNGRRDFPRGVMAYTTRGGVSG